MRSAANRATPWKQQSQRTLNASSSPDSDKTRHWRSQMRAKATQTRVTLQKWRRWHHQNKSHLMTESIKHTGLLWLLQWLFWPGGESVEAKSAEEEQRHEDKSFSDVDYWIFADGTHRTIWLNIINKPSITQRLILFAHFKFHAGLLVPGSWLLVPRSCTVIFSRPNADSFVAKHTQQNLSRTSILIM